MLMKIIDSLIGLYSEVTSNLNAKPKGRFIYFRWKIKNNALIN